MGLKKCRACGWGVSWRAKVCPHCGQPHPVRVTGWALWCWVAVAVFGGVLVIGLAAPGGKLSPRKPEVRPSTTRRPPRRPAKAQPAQPAVKVTLDKFTLDRGAGLYWCDVALENRGRKAATVHVVVYAKNDGFVPPRRGAWPMPGLLFGQAKTRRADLSHHDVSRDWASRPAESKGWRVEVRPGGVETTRAALAFNQVCQHEAWRGRLMDGRAVYREWQVWVFSAAGKLVEQRTYKVAPP